jgi:hypothetical protein
MPFSRSKSRPRLPLLRSLSANNVGDTDARPHVRDEPTSSATSSDRQTESESGNARQPASPTSGNGWFPTLTSLKIRRRQRTRSDAKRTSLESNTRERRQEVVSARATDTQSPQRSPGPPPNHKPELNPAPAAPNPPDFHSALAAITPPESTGSDNIPTPLLTNSSIDDTTPSTPPPVPSCPQLIVQRPSTPTVPTLENTACVEYDPADMQRKLWVKRAGASATRVEVAQDDLVDNVRDVILRKYANSLGRNIDSPDITLKIVSREQNNKNVNVERALGPEEPIGATLDAYYPGGQTIDEALIIDIPQRRSTPRASPRGGNHHVYYYPEQYRPDEAAREYFPPMALHSPHLAHVPHAGSASHAMAVLTTGQLPPMPSPGSHARRRPRPPYGRQHTSSPTILHTVQSNGQVIGVSGLFASGGNELIVDRSQSSIEWRNPFSATSTYTSGASAQRPQAVYYTTYTSAVAPSRPEVEEEERQR